MSFTIRPAYVECDTDDDPLYYIALADRRDPPYLRQVEVTAILDVADDGTLAGVELVFGDLPPPPLPRPWWSRIWSKIWERSV